MTEMQKHIYDENNGLWYELTGDYYIPLLALPVKQQRPIGKWGRMRWNFLMEHRPLLYNVLLFSGKLWTHLADLDERAQERLSLIVEQMKVTEGVTEKLKAADQIQLFLTSRKFSLSILLYFCLDNATISLVEN